MAINRINTLQMDFDQNSGHISGERWLVGWFAALVDVGLWL